MSEMLPNGGGSEQDGFQAGRNEGRGNGRDTVPATTGDDPVPPKDRQPPGEGGGLGEETNPQPVDARAGALPPVRDDVVPTGGNPPLPPPDRGGPPYGGAKHTPKHHRP